VLSHRLWTTSLSCSRTALAQVETNELNWVHILSSDSIWIRIENAQLARNRWSPAVKCFARRFDCSRFTSVVLRNLNWVRKSQLLECSELWSEQEEFYDVRLAHGRPAHGADGDCGPCGRRGASGVNYERSGPLMLTIKWKLENLHSSHCWLSKTPPHVAAFFI